MLSKTPRSKPQYFRLCTFKDGKMDFLNGKDNTTSFEEIALGRKWEKEADIRISLYENQKGVPWSSGDAQRKGFLIDLDGVHKSWEVEIIQLLSPVECKYYLIYTGGGFHIYFPIINPMVKKRLRGYKDSYSKFVDRLFKGTSLEENIDKQVFLSGWFTRMPGSFNSKYEEDNEVRFCHTNLCPTLKDASYIFTFDISAVQQSSNEEPIKIETGLETLREQCSFVDESLKDFSNLKYEEWMHLGLILGKRGESELFYKLSEKLENRQGKAEALLDKAKDSGYNPPACTTISALHDKCKRCGHLCKGNTPATISGKYPTPDAIRGHHPVKFDKDSGSYFTDYENYNLTSVVGEYLNKHPTYKIGSRSSLHGYVDGILESICGNMRFLSRYHTSFLNAIKEIPTRPMESHASLNELPRLLERTIKDELRDDEVDRPHLIGVKDGVLNLNTMELEPHGPEHKLTLLCDVDYRPEFDYSFIEDVLTFATNSKEDTKLIQAFMGLAISNIPSSEYHSMLWMGGMSGGGKSTLLNFLRPILGRKGRIPITNIQADWTKGCFTQDILPARAIFIDEFKYEKKTAQEINNVTKILNGWVSGEEQRVNIKYEVEFSAVLKATVLLTSNHAPLINDEGQGFKRRLRYSRFQRALTTEQQDRIYPSTQEEARKVSSAFFNFCLDGLKEAKERKKKYGSYLPPYTPNEQRFFENLEMEAQDHGISGGIYSPKMFLKEHYEVTTEPTSEPVEFAKLQSKFSHLCNTRGAKILPPAVLRERINEFCLEKLPIGVQPEERDGLVYFYPYLEEKEREGK